MKKISRGFTLIELLVVIAIIGLLSAVIIAPIQSSRKKARDAKRVSELREIKKALEIYFDDNGSYPSTCAMSYSGASWAAVLPTNYLPRMPLDPINTTSQYGYYYCIGYKPSGLCSYISTGLSTDYILATRLENNGSNSAACQSVFSGWDSGVLNYLLGNS